MMAIHLVIKKATENEIRVIHQLAVEIWHAYYPGIISVEQIEYMLSSMYSEASLRQQMQEGHGFYIASEKDHSIGYFSYSEKAPNNFFLHKLYIKTAAHRKGVGGILFNHLLKLLPESSEVRLTVNRKNLKAINFYFKHGFVIEEAKDFDIGNGFFMNDFVMVWNDRQNY